MKKILVLFLFTFIVMGLVSAAPPFETQSYGELTIVYPKYVYVGQNTEHTLYFHVINQTSKITNQSTSCYFHLYGTDWNHTMQVNTSFHTDELEFYTYINANNFSETGTHAYVIECLNSHQTGIASGIFIVNENGYSFDSSDTLVIIGYFLIAAILLVIGITFSKEKWKLRLFFIILSLLMSLIGLSILKIILGSKVGLETMGATGLYLGIVIIIFTIFYLVINWILENLSYFREKSRMKWEVGRNVI